MDKTFSDLSVHPGTGFWRGCHWAGISGEDAHSVRPGDVTATPKPGQPGKGTAPRSHPWPACLGTQLTAAPAVLGAALGAYLPHSRFAAAPAVM